MRQGPHGTMKDYVFNNIMVALNHIENAHAALNNALKNEHELDPEKLNELYDYGLDVSNFHKIKLANVKKAILSITGNQQYKRDKPHAVSEMSLSAHLRD